MRADATLALLRRGLLGLAALTTLGITLEMITERHWTQPVQLIAWGALALLALAIGLLWGQPSRTRLRVAQGLAALVVVSAAVGVWQHIVANYDVAPLDYRYAQTWDGMSAVSRWWLAARKGVGPSPPLAPGALAQAGLCVLLVAVRHPALHTDQATTAQATNWRPSLQHNARRGRTDCLSRRAALSMPGGSRGDQQRHRNEHKRMRIWS